MSPGASLSSKQLVHAALKGQQSPRLPAGPLAVHFCAGLSGLNLHDYSTNPLLLAESVLRYYELFRPDAVWLSADTWVSAQAMGARVGSVSPDQPLAGLGPPLIASTRDLDRVPPPDPGSQGRYPLMLDALSRLVRALGKEVFIVACFDQYPFSLAAALLGMNEIMLKLRDDPALVEAVMHRASEYALAYARDLAAAGADMLSGGDSPAGLIGPQAYRNLALPFEARLIAQIKAATAKPVSLHICGQALPLLGDMALSGVDVLEIDHRVDLGEACRQVGPQIALWGNLDPVGLLAQGTAGQVEQATRETLDVVARAAHPRFVLSSGCTLAVGTPRANLQAMLATARAWSPSGATTSTHWIL